MTPLPKTPWTARVLTLFPEMFPGPLGHSLAGAALADGVWRLDAIDIRAFATDRHRTVDDTPFGGGPGMVMRADVVDRAIASAVGDGFGLIYLTPRGRPLDQDTVRHLVSLPGIVVLCGRFEGVDQRVIDARALDEISIGDYVLSGGEPAALVLIDACVRLLDGVLTERTTLNEESFEGGLLEYPHYTRPADWAGHLVPEVLTSGHHEKIRAWRQDQAEQITRTRRPDLWARVKGRSDTEH